MSAASETLQIAVAHHQAGRLRAAEAIYRQILAADPKHADAAHLLGLVASQSGQEPQAVELIEQAIRLRPGEAVFHFNLAGVLLAQGHAERAAACYREAARLQPGFVGAHVSLGAVLNNLGRRREAASSFEAALAVDPTSAETQFNLGSTLHALEDWQGADAAYREAIRLKGNYVEALINLSDVLRHEQRFDEARNCCERALELQPSFAEAHNNLGAIFATQQRLDEAASCYRLALDLLPDSIDVLRNLAAVLRNQDRFEEAEACYRRVAELRPESAEAHATLASILERQGKLDEALANAEQALTIDANHADAHRIVGAVRQQHARGDEALASYERAIALEPANAEFRFLRSTVWLMRGDFARGWPEFESRLRTQYALPPHPQPRWHGEGLGGRRILIHHEWGMGDTLQFVRYAPLVEARGGEVILEVPGRLVPLLRASGYRKVFVTNDPALPECQWHAPIFSLPGIFQTTLATIPARVPYLAAPRELLAYWRERLRAYRGFKVGIHWHSGRKALVTGPRSMPLDAFEPLARVDGVTLFSLQRHPPTRGRRGLADTFDVVDFGNQLDAGGAFLDTAAIVQNLDLVITCDTSTAHVAGGLGVPVWVALPFAGEFRWLLGRSDSPWYPTMRLFRQPSLGNWTGAFAEMARELAGLVASAGSAPADRKPKRI